MFLLNNVNKYYMDKNSCAPGKGDPVSCYSEKSLRHIAKLINNDTNYTIDNGLSKKELWDKIYEIMMRLTSCKTESCWLKNVMMNKLPEDIREDVRRKTFKPFMPRTWENNYNEWLSTVDINAVLKQYEDHHKDFKLYGPTPIDFDLKHPDGSCKVDSLCSIDIKSLLDSGIRKIGIVFNTDPHYKGGQHWISMYVDLYDDNCFYNGGRKSKRTKKHKKTHTKYKKIHAKHKRKHHNKKHTIKKIEKGELLSDDDLNNKKRCSGMYFFDSQGIKPPNNIVELMEKLCKQGDDCNIKFQKLYNDNQHQYKNTECGIYSIHFIINMLEGMKFRNYINTKRKDEDIEKFRKIFYIDQRLI